MAKVKVVTQGGARKSLTCLLRQSVRGRYLSPRSSDRSEQIAAKILARLCPETGAVSDYHGRHGPLCGLRCPVFRRPDFKEKCASHAVRLRRQGSVQRVGVMRFGWLTQISEGNLRALLSLFSEDLAIDLGTVNTRVYVRGRGVVVNEPSTVAVDKNTGEMEAVGKLAKEMLGRTPANLAIIRPLKDGVIADFKMTERMLSYFIQQAHQRRMLVHPRVVISVPAEITQVEKRAVTDSGYRAKAAHVFLVEQAMMAAIGAGLPVSGPGGNLIVDIGGGTTDVAVISLRGIVYSRSLRVAGNHMDEAIMNYLKRKYNLLIGERTAEQIKLEIGSAYPLDKPLTMETKGRSLIEGVPRTVTVDDSEIREALSECLASIVSAIRVALERMPPELSADIGDRGIVLVGGGALLKNLDHRIREETGLPVSTADDPLYCVVRGTGKMLSDFQLLRKISIE